VNLQSLEICVHCVGLFYNRLLCFQLTSLIGQNVRVTVVTSDADKETWSVLDHFSGDVDICRLLLPGKQAMRRAIGRNIVAKRMKCDFVWFADADHLLNDIEGIRKALANVPQDVMLVYPKAIMATPNHATGEAMIKRCEPPCLMHPSHEDLCGVLPPDADTFVPMRIGKAIGGLQIVRGYYCREHGYLDKTKWQDPPSKDEWQETRDDVVFRKSVPGPHMAIDLPGIYRIRHRRAKDWWPQ
jgi:hypothetical protein